MELLEEFFENLDEGNRRMLSLALGENPYAFFARNLQGGNGKKTHATFVKAVLEKVMSNSDKPINKQCMAQLYMLYVSSTSDIAMSSTLDDVDIGSTLDTQNMTWGYIHKTGVWDRVRSALKENGMSGVEIPSSARELEDLYTRVKKEKNVSFMQNVDDYVTVSYVQTKKREEDTNDCAPDNWSRTVAESMVMVREIYEKMYGTTNVGLWWDKLASKQYIGAQKSWPATANLQFPTHFTVVCLPLAKKEDYDVPLWSSMPIVDEFMDEIVQHIKTCPSCAGMPWVNECGSPRVSPSMSSRCWPLMEIRLANMNIGAFINEEQAGILLDTIHTVLFAWYTCNSAFEHNYATYNMHTKSLSYCNEFDEYLRGHSCTEVSVMAHRVMGDTLRPQDMDKIQKEFISIIGIMMNIVPNVIPLELYLDSKKNSLHSKIKNMYRSRSELEDDEKDNISTLKSKHELTRWEPESVANTINEILNGYAYNSPCYDPRDKMVAAICLMDVELTHEVLRSWNPGSDVHPFASLCNKENWEQICRSDNMNRMSVEFGRTQARRVEGFWTGCMQSKLDGSIFVDAALNILKVGHDVLHDMQDEMQREFNDKINVKGSYFEGMEACVHFAIHRDQCIECSRGFTKHSEVVGRYTVIATKQLRGVTQIATDGDTQIVLMIGDKVHTVANILTGFDDFNAATCSTCGRTSAIVNYEGVPTGVACVHIIS